MIGRLIGIPCRGWIWQVMSGLRCGIRLKSTGRSVNVFADGCGSGAGNRPPVDHWGTLVHCSSSCGSAVKASRRTAGNEGTYQDHVRRQELAYVVEYENFEAGLTPEQRIALGKAAAPDIPDHITSNSKHLVFGISRDISESSIASVDWQEIEDDPVDYWQEELPSISRADEVRLQEIHCAKLAREAEERRAADLLQLISVFLDAGNLRLNAAGLAFAAGLPSVGGCHSMHEWAQAHGVTRVALSKTARLWQKRLNLPPGPHLRADDLCEVYSQAQTKSHWRNRQHEH